MTKTSLWVAAAVALATASPIAAAPINLDFSFDGVSGTFFGLDDAVAGAQMASSFDFFGIFDQYLDVEISPFATNSFTFDVSTGGLSAVVAFVRDDVNGASGEGKLDQLQLSGGPTEFIGSALEFGLGTSFDLHFGVPVITTSPVSAVPLPAGGLLLLSGFVGVAGLKRRNKRAA